MRRIHLGIDSWDRYRWITLASIGLLAIADGGAAFGRPPIDLHRRRIGPTSWIRSSVGPGRPLHRLGEWGLAWKYHPLGIVTVLAVAVLVLRATFGL